MLPPEDYARKSRRWGLASVGSYAAFISASVLDYGGILEASILVPLAIVSAIVCLITTGMSLVRWTQCDVSEGRFFARPGRSLLVRLTPGIIMMCAAAVPLELVRAHLFISGSCYSLLAIIGELVGSVWATRLRPYPPLIPAVFMVVVASSCGAGFGFYIVALIPYMISDIGVVIALLVLGGFSLVTLKRGSYLDNVPAFPPPKRFPRPLIPRERMTLIVFAGLDFVVAAFALWIGLNLWL